MNYDIDQIVAELDSIDCFNEEDLNDEQCEYIWGQICEKTCYNDDNASYGSGASKFVIIPKDTDYVIKIPFATLDTDEDSYYNAETHEWNYGDPEPLQYEYCFKELENYNSAKVCYSGAEIFLAKTERIYIGKTINGYVQEKVINCYDWCHAHEIEDLGWDWNALNVVKNSYKSYNADSSIDQVVNQYDDIPAVWWNQLYKYATENDKMKEVEQFFDFLIDTEINDLCARNIGFIGDKPVLMDYAGWYEN